MKKLSSLICYLLFVSHLASAQTWLNTTKNRKQLPAEVFAKTKFTHKTNNPNQKIEGAMGDVDGDGWNDLVAGANWYKYQNGDFRIIKIGNLNSLVAVGKFKQGRTLQVVGVANNKLVISEWEGEEGVDSVTDASKWQSRDLGFEKIGQLHTLQAADINNDGFLDFLIAEVAEAVIYYGDGHGIFRKELLKKKWGSNSATLVDIDSDGDLDVVEMGGKSTQQVQVWQQNGQGTKLDLANLTKNKIGLEIYSLREELNKDVPTTLKKMKTIGFNEIEVAGYYGLTAENFKSEMDKAGLKASGMLFDFDRYKNDIEGIIKEAKLFGVSQVGSAWIPHLKLFTKADAEKGAAVFNEAGEKLKANGIRFYYHCHGYEFRPMKDSEGTYFDYLAKLMKPTVADFQMDVYWALHGGENPAQLLRKYPNRFLSLHLKDMAWGQETGVYSGGAPISNDCVHGQGQQKMRAILMAAIQTGVQYFYIEDENLNAVNQLPLSLAYLKGLK
jgi:sugar phosphate isomerase/epimerase